MSKNVIPANAHNKVVAGENAKELTKEILEGIVRNSTEGYIDSMVDATWGCFSEYTPIEYDCWGNLWAVECQFEYNAGTHEAIWEGVQEMCDSEGYDIDLYDWCEENDIDLDEMIDIMADDIVEDNGELDWFYYSGFKYLGVFYRSYEENVVCECQAKYDDELKALVGDAKSVDELDVKTCKRLVQIQKELFADCSDECVCVADVLGFTNYNLNLCGYKHYKAIEEKAQVA
jgi:hypothetical protein